MPPPCLPEVLFVIVPLINVVIPPASEPVPPLHLTPPLPPEVFSNISGPDVDLPITSVAPYPEKTAPALSPDLLLCIFPE